MLPMAVPGLVLGLGYIFFFNAQWQSARFHLRHHGNPGASTRSRISTRSAHLTAVTALKQIDRSSKSVSASLKVPFYRTFWRVTVPVCMPAILDIAHLPVRQRDDHRFGGDLPVLRPTPSSPPSPILAHGRGRRVAAAAAAMAMMIVYTSAGVRLLHTIGSAALIRRTQAWRRR